MEDLYLFPLITQMKDLSYYFLFKNSIGAKMKKSFRTFCNGDNSTSTLNQHNNPIIINHDEDHHHHHGHDAHDHCDDTSCTPTPSSPYFVKKNPQSRKTTSSTLEEMILQLEIEEERARREKRQNDDVVTRGRMSCVNNSDILRSARNALNQYPRFSLDGKDAMYRSSFRNADSNYLISKSRNAAFLPPKFGGESVIWCKPGVVAKLMGLEAMPIPINSKLTIDKENASVKSILRRQNLRKRAERHEFERRIAMDNYLRNKNCDGSRRGNNMGSCSKSGSCPAKGAIMMEAANCGGGWPTRRVS